MDLISRIFVKDAGERITIPEIKAHRWFAKTAPREAQASHDPDSEQTVEAIRDLIEKARSKDEDPKEVDALLNEVLNDEEEMV